MELLCFALSPRHHERATTRLPPDVHHADGVAILAAGRDRSSSHPRSSEYAASGTPDAQGSHALLTSVGQLQGESDVLRDGLVSAELASSDTSLAQLQHGLAAASPAHQLSGSSRPSLPRQPHLHPIGTSSSPRSWHQRQKQGLARHLSDHVTARASYGQEAHVAEVEVAAPEAQSPAAVRLRPPATFCLQLGEVDEVRQRQKLYNVASPFSSLAVATAVEEDCDDEARPGSLSLADIAPVIAAYSLFSEGTGSDAAGPGPGFGWLYSSDDEDECSTTYGRSSSGFIPSPQDYSQDPSCNRSKAFNDRTTAGSVSPADSSGGRIVGTPAPGSRLQAQEQQQAYPSRTTSGRNCYSWRRSTSQSTLCQAPGALPVSCVLPAAIPTAAGPTAVAPSAYGRSAVRNNKSSPHLQERLPPARFGCGWHDASKATSSKAEDAALLAHLSVYD